jgi:hypothetical protein
MGDLFVQCTSVCVLHSLRPADPTGRATASHDKITTCKYPDLLETEWGVRLMGMVAIKEPFESSTSAFERRFSQGVLTDNPRPSGPSKAFGVLMLGQF